MLEEDAEVTQDELNELYPSNSKVEGKCHVNVNNGKIN